jgi:lactate permease
VIERCGGDRCHGGVESSVFVQILQPIGSGWLAAAIALSPLAVLLVCLAGLRISAWAAVLLCAAMTVVLAVVVWHAPVGETLTAYGLGAATGLWSVDWIVFWGLIIYNTLLKVGGFAALRDWLVMAAGPDIRVQVLVLAWAFGALLEGLVGFGYPWAVVAPILIGLGMSDLAALRAAALGNTTPVSYGALGAPIIGLAAVTGLPLLDLSAGIGKIVAVLAFGPPLLLIYLVSGRAGLRTGWPLAVVASLGFVAGQLPTSQFLGPYLPAVIGAITCLAALLGFLRVWTPAPLPAGSQAFTPELPVGNRRRERRLAFGAGILPIGVLVAVVMAWTGPWSPLPRYVPLKLSVAAQGSLGAPVVVTFSWAPFVAGTATLTAWLLISAYLRPSRRQLTAIFRSALSQMWGALLVAPLVFGLAAVFNFSGMANTLAATFARLGPAYVLLAPLLGWIAVALSGSNTSSNTLFGAFQLSVGRLLGVPDLLFPALNSVGAAFGKPIAPQTASVGVSTTGQVRREGNVIRFNLTWTVALLGYLLLTALLFSLFLPHAIEA